MTTTFVTRLAILHHRFDVMYARLFLHLSGKVIVLPKLLNNNNQTIVRHDLFENISN